MKISIFEKGVLVMEKFSDEFYTFLYWRVWRPFNFVPVMKSFADQIIRSCIERFGDSIIRSCIDLTPTALYVPVLNLNFETLIVGKV